MEVAAGVVALVIVVAALSAASDRFRWPTPLVLLVAGAAVSFLPLVPEVRLEPELVLNGLLPPLLYATTMRTSLYDFRRNRFSTLMMSVVLVLFTAAVVAGATWLLLPGASLALCLALGAVVAPPDAVAAAALGQRLGLPRRVATLLEQESLVNDAAALVTLSVAVSALVAWPSPLSVAGSSLLAVGGAVVVGGVVAAALAAVRRRITNPVLDTSLSFVAPYLAFLPAEAVHASGVLAVVITGLAMAHLSPSTQTATSRVSEAVIWRAIAFLLENAVFLLIGLQLPALLAGAAESDLSPGRIVVLCAGVLVATVAARFVFVFGTSALLRGAPERMRPERWPAGVSVLVSWAGMRGVVTLAAAQLIPEGTPHRDVLLLVAFAVVVGTLLVQGSTLPWLVRRVGMPAPDPAEDALAAAALGDHAAAAGTVRLDALLVGDEPAETVRALRARSAVRSNAAWERLGRPLDGQMTPSALYTRLRLEMLDAEREVVVRARDTGGAEPEVLRAAFVAIDLEESLLDRVEELDELDHDRALLPRAAESGCAHLRACAVDPVRISAAIARECQDCVREGTTWVHLRQCLSCGYVGCCDSSERPHARRHFGETGHPVMASAEPGEAWRWCWIDEQIG